MASKETSNTHIQEQSIRLRVKEEMDARKMGIDELVKLSGCSRATISRMRNNPLQQQYNAKTIAAIACALKLKDPGVLFEWHNY